MRHMLRGKRMLSLLTAFALCIGCCAAPAEAADVGEEGIVIRLNQTEGTVSVQNSSGKEQTPRAEMQLYSGYTIASEEESYAWFSLDSEKLAKLDALSEAEVRRAGKQLELLLKSGNLFFNVTQPLAEDESLNIRTSTMVAGIRGTCGWVKQVNRCRTEVYLLEGTLDCAVTDPVTGQTKTITLHAGETAAFVVYPPEQSGTEKCDILQRAFREAEIDGFVLVELVRDAALCEKIYQASGLDVLGRFDAASAEAALRADEAALRETTAPIYEALAQQENHVSQDPVWVGGSRPAGPSVPVGKSAPEQAEAPSKIVPPAEEPPAEEPPAEEPPVEEPPVEEPPVEEPPVEEPPAEEPPAEEPPVEEPPVEEPPAETPPPNTPVVTLTMPVTAQQVQDALDGTQVQQVIVQPGTPAGAALDVDIPLHVDSGKTLTLNSGVPASVTNALTVNGTMAVDDQFENSGTVTVNSANTLRVSGTLTNRGTLTNTATGHIVAGGLYGAAGTLHNSGLIEAPVTLAGGSFVMDGGEISLSGAQSVLTFTGPVTLQVTGGKLVNYGSGSVLDRATPEQIAAILAGAEVYGASANILAGYSDAALSTYDYVVSSLSDGMYYLGRLGGAFVVFGGTPVTDYTYTVDSATGEGLLTISGSVPLTIHNREPGTPVTNGRIFVADGVSANLTLDGVNIDLSARSDGVGAALMIADDSTGNVTVTLAPGSANNLRSAVHCAGLQKNGGLASGTLTICGTGALTAQGGSGDIFSFENGAGIGGGYEKDGCNIVIREATIDAIGGANAAGIGGGAFSSKMDDTWTQVYTGGVGANLVIESGDVRACSDMGPGIGGMSPAPGQSVIIRGGSVHADHNIAVSMGSEGIGIGMMDGNVIIENGTVDATVSSKRFEMYGGAFLGGNMLNSFTSSAAITADSVVIGGGTVDSLIWAFESFSMFGGEVRAQSTMTRSGKACVTVSLASGTFSLTGGTLTALDDFPAIDAQNGCAFPTDFATDIRGLSQTLLICSSGTPGFDAAAFTAETAEDGYYHLRWQAP